MRPSRVNEVAPEPNRASPAAESRPSADPHGSAAGLDWPNRLCRRWSKIFIIRKTNPHATTSRYNRPVTSNQKDVGMWSFTDPLWETVFKWATIAAAVFGGIGIAAAFVSAWIGYQIADATQKEADKNIAEARAETEKAKLEQERIKEALAWRTLTPEMTAILTESLGKNPSNVNIRYTDGDPEALFLAIQ